MNLNNFLIVMLIPLLAACECSDGNGTNKNQPMSNEEIIESTKQCNAAGLDAEALHNGMSDRTTVIQCKPRIGAQATGE